MDIKRSNGFRILNKSGLERLGCKGNNDTCDHRIMNMKVGFCASHAAEAGIEDPNEGNPKKIGDVRYIRRSWQWRRQCAADDNTCEKLAKQGSKLCDGHISGIQKFSTKDLMKGDKLIRNGKQKIYDGIQIRDICKYVYPNNISCTTVVINGGFCKTHSPAWKCQFTGFPCERIRIYGNYCTLHQDNIQHPKEKSKGETEISKILNEYDNIKYVGNDLVTYQIDGVAKYMYLDFHIKDKKVVIEYDGIQHFTSAEFFDRHTTLQYRNMGDIRKNEYCLQNDYILLRIPYTRFNEIANIIHTFIKNIDIYSCGVYVPYMYDVCLYDDYADTLYWFPIMK